MVLIQPVDPHDEDAFAQWYAVMRTSATHGRTAPTVWAEATLAHWYRHPNPRRSRIALAAVDESRAPDDQVVGVASVELPLDVDTETAEVDVEVLPTERRRGVGSALWDAALEACRAEGRSVLQAEVNVPVGVRDQSSPGLRFARDRGFTSENVEDHLALPLDGASPPRSALAGRRGRAPVRLVGRPGARRPRRGVCRDADADERRRPHRRPGAHPAPGRGGGRSARGGATRARASARS